MTIERFIFFDSFCSTLIGLPVSLVWRGYGSAIFIEFGALAAVGTRRNGSPRNPVGEWTLMIEWGWRIEGKRMIWCGSASDEERWTRAFNRLLGATVASISLVGRLPEIDLSLSNGLHIVSLTTAKGDPEWGLIHHLGESYSSAGVRYGRLNFDEHRDIHPRSTLHKDI